MDRRTLNPRCFMSPMFPMLSYDFCCDMEASGPEGNIGCWELSFAVIPSKDWSYNSCCIAPQNFNFSESSSWSKPGPLVSRRGLAFAFGRLLNVKRPVLLQVLEQLSTEYSMQTWAPYRRLHWLFSAPWWPEESPRPKLERAGPRYLPELLRNPEWVCGILFGPPIFCGGGGTTPCDYCPGFVLLHARAIAAVIGMNRSFTFIFKDVGLI
eukprot:gnl/TRDRNA2_/TRDRNA2_159204_c0_seq1.p1 gnl/TRDRNA2_/TRDRNA2_159204_c0~~gnl/TRDRNA2_/TRDRNA2_159204_c0_seq1.p1  ORF type:complete len:210 (+),score=21.10 gnl/TRDRNA2_/TRDRNA2_159204_c0_seq1:101-730(+)